MLNSEIPCRICCKVGSNKKNRIITPCLCRGVFAYVHKSCLENWLEDNNTDYCDICRFKYKMHKKPKGFVQWLNHDSDELWDLAQTTFLILWCFYLIFIASVLIVGSKGRVDLGLRFLLFVWTIFVCIASFLITLQTLRCKLKDYLEWKKDNYYVKVLENPQVRLEPVTPPRSTRRTSGLIKGSIKRHYEEDSAE